MPAREDDFDPARLERIERRLQALEDAAAIRSPNADDGVPARVPPPEETMSTGGIMPILKPCPFCGDRPQIVHSGTFQVECPDCGAIGPPAPTSQRAIARWNRRGTDASEDFA
jgi:Lar family restriction alleviation protein